MEDRERDGRARAGIDFYGKTLRYAEVERYEAGENAARHRLLRLGSCDFDFEVAHALWPDGSDPDRDERRLDTLAEALAEVFERVASSLLVAVAHPPHAQSFFAPVPAGTDEADRRARFRREAHLLVGSGASPPPERRLEEGEARPEGSEAEDGELHVSGHVLSARPPAGDGAAGADGEPHELFHVLAVGGGAHERLRRAVERLSMSDFQWATSTGAAARAAAARLRSAQAEGEEEGRAEGSRNAGRLALAVGCYHEHLELALLEDGHFRQALHAPHAARADSAYFAAALLNQLGEAPADVSRVFLYGFGVGTPAGNDAPEDFETLRRLTGATPEVLDFRPLLGPGLGRLDEGDFDPAPYAPAVGAVL